MSTSNLAAVHALAAGAEPVVSLRRFDGDPEPGLPRARVDPGRWAPSALGLPEDCPVVPLGIAGNVAWYIDPIGQVQSLAPPYGKGHLLGLFCGRAKGPWNSVAKIRGRGAGAAHRHRPAHRRAARAAGRGRRLRLSDPARHRRALARTRGGQNPARPAHPAQLAGAARGRPVLLLGWIGAAFLGGALPWRPAVPDGHAAPAIDAAGADQGGARRQPRAGRRHLGGRPLAHQHDNLPIAVDNFEGETTAKAVAVLDNAHPSSA
jgi:hypothetical protein